MQIAVSFFGADVGKAEIVVADHGRAKPGTKILKNTPSSLSKWLQTLPQGSVLAMESTGGYERMLADLAHERGLTAGRVTGETVRQAVRRLGVGWKRAKHWITSPDPGYARKKSGGTG